MLRVASVCLYTLTVLDRMHPQQSFKHILENAKVINANNLKSCTITKLPQYIIIKQSQLSTILPSLPLQQPLHSTTTTSLTSPSAKPFTFKLKDTMSTYDHNHWRTSYAPARLQKPAALTPAEKLLFSLSAEGEQVSLDKFLTSCADESLDINVRHPSALGGGTALHLASSLGHAGVVKVLLAHGCEVNAQADNGSTALHWASGAGHVDTVQVLLQNGADASCQTFTWESSLSGRGSGQTAVHWAAESGHDKVIELIAEFDPMCIVTVDERNASPMDVAEKVGGKSVEVLKKLQWGDEYVILQVQQQLSAQQFL